MTFRIDHVSLKECRWECTFKGVHGKGRYGTLVTGSNGSGLYLLSDGTGLYLKEPP